MEWAGLLAATLQSAVAVAWRQLGRRPVQRKHVRLCWIVGYWRAAAAHLTAWRSVWSAAPSASPHNRQGRQDDVRAEVELSFVFVAMDLICPVKTKRKNLAHILFDPYRKLNLSLSSLVSQTDQRSPVTGISHTVTVSTQSKTGCPFYTLPL